MAAVIAGTQLGAQVGGTGITVPLAAGRICKQNATNKRIVQLYCIHQTRENLFF
jgi:hypothetical protein